MPCESEASLYYCSYFSTSSYFKEIASIDYDLYELWKLFTHSLILFS